MEKYSSTTPFGVLKFSTFLAILLYLLLYLPNTQTGDISEFDDKLVRKLVEKATVYDDRIVIELKSGLEIEVNIKDCKKITAS